MNWPPVGLDECLDPGEVVKEVDVIEVEDAEGAALILVLPTQRHDWIFKLGCCHLSSVSFCDMYLYQGGAVRPKRSRPWGSGLHSTCDTANVASCCILGFVGITLGIRLGSHTE